MILGLAENREVTHVEAVMAISHTGHPLCSLVQQLFSALSPSDDIPLPPLKFVPCHWLGLSLLPAAREMVLWLALIK